MNYWKEDQGRQRFVRLLDLKEESDRELRAAAVQTLGALGPDAREAIPQMARLLPVVDLREREAIVRALSSIGRADTVGPTLAEAARSLSDSGDADRMLADVLEDAFRKLGPGVSGEVAKLLKDRRAAVRRLAGLAGSCSGSASSAAVSPSAETSSATSATSAPVSGSPSAAPGTASSTAS